MGERYKSITKETQGVLREEYGATPAAVNKTLAKEVLGADKPITGRPADMLEPEMNKLTADLRSPWPNRQGIQLAAAGDRRCADLCPVSTGRPEVSAESRQSGRLRARTRRPAPAAPAEAATGRSACSM
jgi:hypothetical protein